MEEVSVGQMLAIWGDVNPTVRPATWDEVRKHINQQRAAKGLPPMKAAERRNASKRNPH